MYLYAVINVIPLLLVLNMKKIIVSLLLIIATTCTYAEKLYMGVFKTATEYGAWITLRGAPCNKVDGNAVLMSGNRKENGCWKIENKLIKIEWLNNNVPNFYEMDGFRLVGDTDLDKPQVAQKEKENTSQVTAENSAIQINNGNKTTLYCQSQDWVGDIVIDRDKEGLLKKLTVGGEDTVFEEKESSITFAFNSLNMALSTVTAMFSYESTTASKLLFKANRRGTGRCEVVDGKKKF